MQEEPDLNKFDALILLGSGYTCGCACMAGPAMHSLKDKFRIIKKWPFLWGIVAGINGLLVGIIAVFMFSLFAIGKNPGFPDFWPRALLFTTGLIAGGSLVFAYMFKIEALLKK
ncbi:hypothetical protein K7B09_12910 [Thermomonas sp. RSS23]|uniref:Uncharacterized protein n=1 Tax=Thermomonas beijingensis TaxID=2872701 RepID=A0ABS7TH95_9GAMM|nr:hypothetical protein [Thermomonas beijingensis]MBZ4187222.1 hypothetical protein [Thermomonas beijingensis]